MRVLEHFSVPYLGLNNGKHEYIFEVEDLFFKEFENTEISSGLLNVQLKLDKRPDMGEAILAFDGFITVDCDRCLQPIKIPIDNNLRVHIKYGDEQEEEDEVIFITPDTSSINFAQIIFEYIVLWMPMIKVHNDISECDPVMINKMKNEDLDSDSDNNIWSSLKGLDLN